MASLRNLAELAQVSRTVARVLNNDANVRPNKDKGTWAVDELGSPQPPGTRAQEAKKLK